MDDQVAATGTFMVLGTVVGMVVGFKSRSKNKKLLTVKGRITRYIFIFLRVIGCGVIGGLLGMPTYLCLKLGLFKF